MAKLVVSITHGKNNSDKASLGFVVANSAVLSGVETVVFLSTEGAWLCQRGYTDVIHEPCFPQLQQLIEHFVEMGGTIWVCGSCFRKRGLSEEMLVPGTVVVGGARLVEFLCQEGVTCVSY